MERCEQRMIVFDTYAWIEYFLNTEKADKVEHYLNNDQVITPIVVLLELSSKAYKESWDIKKHIDFIKAKSNIFNINEAVIINSGKLYNKIREKIKNFGLLDAAIFSTAIINKCSLLTGDPHFENSPNVVFLE